MPKRNRKNKSKRMRGGFDMGSLNPFGSSTEGTSSTSSGTGWLGSLTEKAKSASGSATSWFSSSPTTTTTTTAPAAPAPAPASPVVGGKKRKSKRMRGGYSSNISTTNLAASAGSFSGSTARAQAYVGGRTKKRCNKHKRSHRRKCRK